MKPSKRRSTKPALATASKRRAALQKQRAVPMAMPTTPAVVANDLAERIEAHRKQMGSLEDAYRECMRDIFREPLSVARKRALIKKSVRQFAAVLADWQIAALELVSESQAAALLQMLPDPKGGRWLN